LIDPNIVFDSYTTYPSAFLVIDPNGIYSKHYYAGTQRIVSRLGDDNADIFNTGANRTTTEKDDSKKLDETVLRNVQVTDLKAYLKDAKIGEVSFKEYKGSTYQEEETLLAEDLKENREEGSLEQERAPVVAPVYFYHPDHLGSSTFLTDANGNAYQFFINLPFGETMAEQLPDTYYRTPFKFNGKELDEETGLYYYGARFYDPKISIWLSVDPLAEAFPNWNPYNYTMQNPINLVDPTGMSSESNDWHPDKNGNLVADAGDSTQSLADAQGISYDQAAIQLSDNGYTTNDKGIFNLNVGDSVNTGSFNLSEVVVVGGSSKSSGSTNINFSEADVASKYIGDQRIYSMSNKPGTIDCSRFTGDVASAFGYNLPRTAFGQANWYKQQGVWSSNLKDAEKGDHIFWERGKNAYHTGIIIDATKGDIKVIQAQTNKYQPGSIKVQKLMPNGEMRGFNQPFIGIGRKRK
jgi:RHS repeat-associated protein